MDAALPALDLSRVPSIFITLVLQSMSLRERFTCALVCKAWAQEATAATRSSIILKHDVLDLSCLQRWLQNHGNQTKVLQLHACVDSPVLTALPCPQLQELLLRGSRCRLSLDSRVWSDIAAATKLTSISLIGVQTGSRQSDVVSALTALPGLEQLTWRQVGGRDRPFPGSRWRLSDGALLQQLTKLSAVDLDGVTAGALQHVGLLIRLQAFKLKQSAEDWAAAGCPGLQELKALTRLDLDEGFDDIPASISQLTALQQLDVWSATATALNKLSALTGLTQLRMDYLVDMLPKSPPLQLPGLQHLKVMSALDRTMPMSFLASCTQLQMLKLCNIYLSHGSLVVSSMLQHLQLVSCSVSAADGAADPVSWQHVFPGPGRLPHLTSLKMTFLEPALHHAADLECVVACCSNLQDLFFATLPDVSASALTRLTGLTSLTLHRTNDQQCSSLAQLTGLRRLRVAGSTAVSAAGLRQLAALEQLTILGLNNPGWTYDVLREHMSDTWPDKEYKGHFHVIMNKVCVHVWHVQIIFHALITHSP